MLFCILSVRMYAADGDQMRSRFLSFFFFFWFIWLPSRRKIRNCLLLCKHNVQLQITPTPLRDLFSFVAIRSPFGLVKDKIEVLVMLESSGCRLTWLIVVKKTDTGKCWVNMFQTVRMIQPHLFLQQSCELLLHLLFAVVPIFLSLHA